jgi:HD-GYP domain-containing protein (c-di-GMP phosphodiesterase class II)
MITARPYSEAMSTRTAVAELRRCAGSQFDPDVVEVFCAALVEQAGAASAAA